MTLPPKIQNEIKEASVFGRFITICLVIGALVFCVNYTAVAESHKTLGDNVTPAKIQELKKESKDLTLEDKKKIVLSLSDEELLAIFK